MPMARGATVPFYFVVAIGLSVLIVGGLIESPSQVTARPEPAAKPTDPVYEKQILPLLTKYCNGCHNAQKSSGGLALDTLTTEAIARKDRKTWVAVEKVLATGEMPPKKKPQPTKEERELLAGWIEKNFTKLNCTGPQDPGHVTLRRLNRTEYNNTVRDLCGVTIKPADDFPSDDVGYGFDNIGDVLSLPPILLEKYLAAADQVLDAAIMPIATTIAVNIPRALEVVPKSAKVVKADERRPKIILTTEGSASVENYACPATAEYTIRVRAWGRSEGGVEPNMSVRLDGKEIKTFHPPEKTKPLETRLTIGAGNHKITAAFTNPSDPKTLGDKQPRAVGIESIDIDGPIGTVIDMRSQSAKLMLVAMPAGKEDTAVAARKVLANFARRAYRRPVKPEEVDRLMKLFALAESKGEPFHRAIRLPLKAVLVSPNFLFRVEDDPTGGAGVRDLNDFEFAARLSYFLWSSMPDEQLFEIAGRGELQKPAVLKAQIARMLKDDKSGALVENFAGQWLQLRNLRSLSPDTGTFKSWDEPLRAAMIRETELFFEHIVKNDRNVLEFLDANYTFVNERLAKHYGIKGVSGREFRQVKFENTRRGGIVTQASVLTVTSNPTRTSPVKRGKWVLENVLGVQPPPPAPDVPELPPVGQLKGTLRQQMEQHRANASCATCHSKLDPLGFGLENFDGIGGWRDQDNKQPIDSTGVLPDGGKFDGPAELRKVLLGKSDQFRACLAEKLLTFALGRGLEYYDKCAINEIVTKLKTNDDHFSALVFAIAESDAFRKRAVKRSE